MVYCQKCGTQNDESSEFCKKCGASLREEPGIKLPSPPRRPEQECFGIPYGGAIVGLVFGAILIIFGLSQVLGLDIGQYMGSFIMIIIGSLIVIAVLYSYYRRSGR